MDWKWIELAQDGPGDESSRTFRMNRRNGHYSEIKAKQDLGFSVRCCVSLYFHLQITAG
jgi:hypothetical protein